MNRILLLAALFISPVLFAAEDMVTIPTRPGVTQSFLLTSPDKARPDVVLILFPGSHGQIGLRRDNGQLRFGESNFLVRERKRFVDLGAATAVVDVPSDNAAAGMSEAFRMGSKHAMDIGFVIDDLKKRWPAVRVFLVGTSNGTISASAVASRLKDRVDGLVLTSTIKGDGTTGIKKLGKPVLFVHHRLDRCSWSPYGVAKQYSAQFPLITVNGGQNSASGDCDPLSPHGFYGVEAPVTAAIMHWIRHEPYQSEINGGEPAKQVP